MRSAGDESHGLSGVFVSGTDDSAQDGLYVGHEDSRLRSVVSFLLEVER
jgi:hypothetical protein